LRAFLCVGKIFGTHFANTAANKKKTSKKDTIMKLVTAYIQPERLNFVKQALYENKIYKMSVTNVLGCGQQKGYNQRFRGVVTEVNLLKKICLKIAVNDEFVQPCIDAIIKGARTGEIGDGKIFVTSLEQCVRIRTGESGPEAIG
jgi:nitrogen regulatory protein P-II 1